MKTTTIVKNHTPTLFIVQQVSYEAKETPLGDYSLLTSFETGNLK